MQYDPHVIEPAVLVAAISELGYDAKAQSRVPSKNSVSKQISRLIVPANAPKFFVDAIDRAKAARRPIIIDFWAQWCPTCLRLKRETLEHSEAAGVISAIELIYVDLDEYPALGGAYGVVAIPDLFLADSSGRIVDRIQKFVPPKAFAARVRKALGQPVTRGDGSEASSGEGAGGGKLGDVTALTKSLKPLRDHFNANKSKHRFIALLSPT